MTTYCARRLPVHLGPAAWDAILPPRPLGPELDHDLTVDFAVIGGGFAGMAAARHLTQLAPGARIAVLEAGAVAEGASGRNSGFMIDLPHDLASEDYAGSGDDRAVIALNRQALRFAAAAVEDYGIDRNFFDPAGKINGAASPAADAHNASYARHLSSLGEVSERLDAHQMQEITGSAHYLSGLYTPGTVMLQPAGYMRGMADGLRRDGVQVFERSPVTGFSRQGGAWAVATPKARLTAGKVILTVNGHLESFGQARGRLMHLFLFATMTRELDVDALARVGGHPRWGITPSDPMGTTMRRIDSGQGGNRIITRTCAVLRSGMAASPADLHRAARTMRRKFDSRFPQLAGMAMEHSWAGHLCLTMNGVAVMGEIENGVYSGCVQNGLGTARGTLTGIGAAELACGVQSDITRHFTTEAAPTRLPPRPVRDMGANAVLRWKEWKARAE
ncbi:FAD-binding oxidoreductase [Loktanella sp. IMCC34160]|uniref:NAD(P)/FAD-dependent oxidoreductase n=1 Tax=Loktanella sp. IMCC34160 TaxID=2510646 RepID=UPI00101BAD7C|nr:FAD-binding oxidoreductase [Loktanella sp. IMCC34160]RYG90334.1 FAD-binding oxidoreductase [Loktanella sp. IMCC34160]